MSDMSVLLQARREIKTEIAAIGARPDWDRSKKHDEAVARLNLHETNEKIAQLVELGTDGERTLF